MKRIILVFLGLFSLIYSFGQGSPTGAKTQFKNGVALGSKDSSSFTANDSLFLTIDRNNRLMWRGNGASSRWYVIPFTNGSDTLPDTRWVRLQTGNLFRQTGKMWISDTIRTDGLVSALRVTANNTGSTPAINGQNTSTGRGGSFTAATGIGAYVTNRSATNPALYVLQDSTSSIARFVNNFDLGVTIDTSGDVTISNRKSTFTGKIQLPTISANRIYTLPDNSGVLALTSNVTDSSAALRASINTKLNISDTAAMLAPFVQYSDTANQMSGYLRKNFALLLQDTAAMKATITLDRVLQNGNTTGRTITADAFQGKVQTATTTTNANFSIGIYATNANTNQVANVTNVATINPSTGLFGVGSGGISTSGNLTVSGFTYPQDVSLAKGVSFINGGQPSVIANSTAMYVERSGVTTDLIVRTDTSASPFTLRKYLRFNNSTTNTYTFPNSTGTIALTTDTSFSTVTFDRVLANGNTTGRTFTAGGATLTGALSGTTGLFSSTFEAGRTGGAVTNGDLTVDPTSTAAKVIIGRLSSTSNDNTTLILRNRVGTQTGSWNSADGSLTLSGALSGTSGTFSGLLTGARGLYNDFTSGLPATSGSATRGGLRLANSSNIALDFGTVAAGQAWIQVSDANNYASNFPLLLNPNGGNVGIGTTSPNGAFVVASGRSLFNTNTDDGSSIGQFNGNVLVTGALNVTSTGTIRGKAYLRDVSSGSSSDSVLVKANDGEVKKIAQSSVGGIWQRSSALISTQTAGDSLKLNAANGNANYIRTTSNGTFQVRDSASGVAHFTSNTSQAAFIGNLTVGAQMTAKTYAENVVSVSTTYTVASDVGTVYASSNTYTITLPSAIGNAGRTITIKRTSSGSGTSIIVSGVTLGTSENGGSLPCHAAAVYRSDGTNWYCISYHAGGCN